MSILYRMRAIFALTFKRLWAQRSLTLVTILGLATAVSLIMIVPLYADAVYFRILQEELSTGAGHARRPPFTYLYDYVGSWAGSHQWADIQAVDQYLMAQGAHNLVAYLNTRENVELPMMLAGSGAARLIPRTQPLLKRSISRSWSCWIRPDGCRYLDFTGRR
jgi:hypothetical protein